MDSFREFTLRVRPPYIRFYVYLCFQTFYVKYHKQRLLLDTLYIISTDNTIPTWSQGEQHLFAIFICREKKVRSHMTSILMP